MIRNQTILLLSLTFIFVQSIFGQNREHLPSTIFSWAGQRPAALGRLPVITTDRPDFTEASSTVGYGVVQLEMGYTFTHSEGSESHSWGEPLLRFGVVANWLELRMSVSPVSELSTVTHSGTQDMYLGTKLWLVQQQDWLPEVAVMPQMTVPTGTSSFTAGQVLPGVNLLYSWDITGNLALAGSTQYNRALDDTESNYDEWAQSVTVGRSLSDNFGMYLEWFSFFPSGGLSASTEHYMNCGLTYLWNEDIQFDLRIGKGLNDASDDYFTGAGVAFRFHPKAAE
jgi:hypothetical protein